jgi:hypothetical protein
VQVAVGAGGGHGGGGVVLKMDELVVRVKVHEEVGEGNGWWWR